MIDKLIEACKGMDDNEMSELIGSISDKRKKKKDLPEYMKTGDASQYGTRARLPEYMDDDARIAMY